MTSVEDVILSLSARVDEVDRLSALLESEARETSGAMDRAMSSFPKSPEAQRATLVLNRALSQITFAQGSLRRARDSMGDFMALLRN